LNLGFKPKTLGSQSFSTGYQNGSFVSRGVISNFNKYWDHIA